MMTSSTAAVLVALLSTAQTATRPRPAFSLELSISCACDQIRVGDEIPVVFTVTNVGSTVYEFGDRDYDRSGRMPEYRLDAYDETRQPIVDPRMRGTVKSGFIGGGLGAIAQLEPGHRFSKTIPLNWWAYIQEPGVYTVVGTYAYFGPPSVRSSPLTITVLPRTADDMGRYIDSLVNDLRNTSGGEARWQAIRRLMYTGDARAVPPLLALSIPDNNTSFWITEAFAYYLPKTPDVREQVLDAVRARGLSASGVRLLEEQSVDAETIKALIAVSLVADDDGPREAAAFAAQRYPDDRLMEGLIALAQEGPTLTRQRAIFALAYNRTDAAVALLRRLRQDPDESIRKTAETAIAAAYRDRGSNFGRPLRPDDFPDLAP